MVAETNSQLPKLEEERIIHLEVCRSFRSRLTPMQGCRPEVCHRGKIVHGEQKAEKKQSNREAASALSSSCPFLPTYAVYLFLEVSPTARVSPSIIHT